MCQIGRNGSPIERAIWSQRLLAIPVESCVVLAVLPAVWPKWVCRLYSQFRLLNKQSHVVWAGVPNQRIVLMKKYLYHSRSFTQLHTAFNTLTCTAHTKSEWNKQCNKLLSNKRWPVCHYVSVFWLQLSIWNSLPVVDHWDFLKLYMLLHSSLYDMQMPSSNKTILIYFPSQILNVFRSSIRPFMQFFISDSANQVTKRDEVAPSTACETVRSLIVPEGVDGVNPAKMGTKKVFIAYDSLQGKHKPQVISEMAPNVGVVHARSKKKLNDIFTGQWKVFIGLVKRSCTIEGSEYPQLLPVPWSKVSWHG